MSSENVRTFMHLRARQVSLQIWRCRAPLVPRKTEVVWPLPWSDSPTIWVPGGAGADRPRRFSFGSTRIWNGPIPDRWIRVGCTDWPGWHVDSGCGDGLHRWAPPALLPLLLPLTLGLLLARPCRRDIAFWLELLLWSCSASPIFDTSASTSLESTVTDCSTKI